MNAPSPNETTSAVTGSSFIPRSSVTCSFQTATLVTRDSPSKYRVPDCDINSMTHNTSVPVTSHQSGSPAETSTSLVS